MAKALLRSFAGGVITPEMYGRLDLTKFQTGLATAENFVTLPHGPAARRPGTYFVQQAANWYTGEGDPTQFVTLIPYIVSEDLAFVVEVGPDYLRFHNQHGTELESPKTITNVTQANPAVFTSTGHGFATGDTVYVVGIGGMTSLNARWYVVDVINANSYRLRPRPLASSPGGVQPLVSTVSLPAYTGGGTASRVYTVTPGFTSSRLSLRYSQVDDVLTVCDASGTMPAKELRRLGAGNWQVTDVAFTVSLAAPTGVSAIPTAPTPTNMTTASYVVTAVGPDLVTESAASAVASATNNLNIAGNFNTVSWSIVSGAARYYVYKLRGGVYGYIGQTTGTSIVDDNIVPDTLTTPPVETITLNTIPGTYPRAVTHYEQRRWFGAPGDRPQTVIATRVGTDNNLTGSVPTRADDAFEVRIAAQRKQTIKHLVALQDVVALTTDGEFRVFADGGPAIALDTLSIKPQSSVGAADPHPALADDRALYVQAQGSYIRELSFDPSGLGRFTSTNVSVMAPHLFDGYTVAQLAYTRAPMPVLWCVRSDGVLLGLTHMPNQEVYGWHVHRVGGGLVESVAVIPEGNEDVLYLAVRRYSGTAWVTHIERLTPRLFLTSSAAYFVDCGLTYQGPPVTTVSGLWHLEGMTVDILADGAVVTPQTVTGGRITLSIPASTVHVGLNYVSDLQTLPQSYDAAPAGGQAARKNVSSVTLRVKDSSLVKAGPTFTKLRQYPAREVSDPYGSPPALRTGEVSITVDPSWTNDGQICVRQDQPLPLTVCSIAHETAIGG